ncbi:Transcription factor [Sesamum alatum]|uniref:Transcription factor n=1 Tax=Sesamum alatum TaxID=300844 RepID=A0AAE1Z194_9LAMI|nr:Transcription factor [Sesamum alatum]
MALSYYSNWAAFQQLDSDMSFLDPFLTELPFPNIDSLFDQTNDLFYSECSNSLLYDFSPSTGVTSDNIVNSIPTQPFSLQQEFESSHNPNKRQKLGCGYEESYSSTEMFYPPHFNGLFPDTCLTQLQDYLPTEVVVPPLPDFSTSASPGFSYGSQSPKKEASSGGGGGGSLSAQSVAARQRRRKITEKTQELGKLVPGGRKMNTAEMLQAAYKYIKYLQAQVGVLESIMPSNNNQENSDEELRFLLESPLIQEKLYSTERCLVPGKFVQELSSDDEIVKSNPQLLPLIVKQEQ